MGQQVDTDRGRQVKRDGREGRGGRGYGGRGYRGQTPFISKAFKYPIVEIASNTFNIGQSKFAAQFTQPRKEAYLVVQTIRMGVLQTIDLPPPITAKYPDVDELTIVRLEVVRVVVKRRITLNQDLKKVFATVYD